MKISIALSALGLLAGASVANAQYRLVVAETTFGSNSAPYTNGIRQYKISVGGAATLSNGIAAGSVLDPAGLALSASGELFVGNRNGNANNSGGGTISRFLLNEATDTFAANGGFAVGQTGTHGVSFSPSGELFASNVSGGVSRFTLSGATASPSGTLGGGTTRDTFISPDSRFAYVTEGVSGNLLKYDLATGTYLGAVNLPGASGLHFGSWLGDQLYVADFPTGNIYAVSFNAAGDATGSVVANASTAISVAFSPIGDEMFVAGHTSGVISRYTRPNGAWTLNDTIATNVNMGDLQVIGRPVPEPASLAALGIGALALLGRRRK